MAARPGTIVRRSTRGTAVPRTLVLALCASVLVAVSATDARSADQPVVAAVTADLVVDSTADTSDSDTTDGACDDGTGACTIRAAVEQANATGGALTIGVPAGTYLIATAIEVTGDVTLSGAGISQTILSPATNSTPQLFLLATGASFAAHAITFDTPAASGPAVIEVDGTDASVHVADAEFLGGRWAGIFVDDTADRAVVQVVRSRFADVEYPIFLLAGEQVFELRDSLIERGGYSGLFVDTDGGRFSVIDSGIVDTPDGGSGIEFWTNTGAGPVRLDIIRSRISRNTNQGVRLGPQSEDVETFVVDSVIEDSGNIGMWLEGDLTITDSIFRDNPQDGLDHSRGSLTITGSTFTGNGGYGIGAYSLGGPSATIVNTTVSGNGTDCGGCYELHVGNYGVAELTNVTVTGPGYGLGMYATSYSIRNTVIHGGTAACDQPYVSAGHNADTDGTCGFDQAGDLTATDPLLGPLADNGGPTPTHQPATGSPLIDAGSATDCPALDQRGAARPADGTGDGVAVCDVGAVEAAADVVAGDLTVTWEADPARRGMLRPDGDLTVTVTGADGATSATADVEVSSWYPSGDTTATMLDAPARTTVPVTLGAAGAGTFSGQLPLEGIASVSSIGVSVQTPAGTVVDATTERLPVDVAGGLEIRTELHVPGWALPAPRVWVRSATSNDGDALAVPLMGAVTSRWLEPATDYVLEVADSANRVVADGFAAAEVRAGLLTTVTLAGTPLPYVPLTAVVVDANGQPVDGVQVTVTDQATGDQVTRTVTGADARVPATARGADVVVSIDPLGLPYAPVTRPVTLTALDSDVTFELGATLPTATVSGIVEHPHRPPVAGARVTLTTVLADGRALTTATRAGEDGRYAAAAFQGEVTVRVDEPRAGRAESTVTVAGDTVVDLLLDGPAIGTLGIDLRTRMAGETSFTSLPLDGTTGYHFRVHIFDHTGKYLARAWSDVVDVPVRVGELLRVCADGREAQLPSTCVEVPVDAETLHAQATLELSQAGSVAGTMSWTAPDWFEGERYAPIVEARVFAVEAGMRRFVRTYQPTIQTEPTPATPQQASFDVGLFEDGVYEIRFAVDHMIFESQRSSSPYVGTDHARVHVEVADGTALLLGDVPLSSGGWFAESPGSSTSMTPTTVVPGDRVQLRVSAQNDADTAVEAARLRLELPAGTSLVPGSVVLDGAATTSTATDGTLEVAVGTIGTGQRAVVTAWVTVPADIDADTLWTQGSIVHGTTIETTQLLGSGVAAVRRLTLEFDRHASTLDIPVWGRAEPNSTVEVLVDGSITATTTATPGGAWSTTLSLPASPLPRFYGVQAAGELGGQPVTTRQRHVSYDPTYPQLERAVVHQPSGRVIEMDPSQGVARFPYVYVPGPVLVDLQFNHPQMVEGLEVSIGPATTDGSSYIAAASYDSATGLWRATLNPGASQLGEIRAGWKARPNPVDLHPEPTPAPLTSDEVRAALRPPLSTFTGLSVEDDVPPPPDAPDGTTVNRVSVELPDLEATMDVEIRTEPGTYTPTDRDLANAAEAGVALYGVETTTTFDANVATVTVRAFVPDPEQAGVETATASADDGVRTSAVGAASIGQLAGRFVTVVKNIRFMPELDAATEFGEFVASFTMTFVDTLDNVADALANEDNWAALHKLQDLITNCDPGSYARYEHELNIHAAALLGQTTINAAGALLGLVTMPTGVGLAVGAVTLGLDRWMSADIAASLAALHDRIVASCPEAEPTGGSAEIGPPGDDDHPIADPTWIWDPSGYVYEVFEDDRLEGVTATLQHAPTASGPWEIWDAEWYLQDNPLVTDPQGAYGWDVPEGWWRVRYDKAGYVTAYSDALQVLPPHFDVNVGMLSLQAPAFAPMAATDGDTTLDVVFAGYMDAATLDDRTIRVTAGAEDLTGSVTPTEPRTTPSGMTVTTTATVTLTRAVALHETLTIVADRSTTSYAGVPAGADLATTVVVGERPPPGDPGDDTTPEDTATPPQYRHPGGIGHACPDGQYATDRFPDATGTHAVAIDCAVGWGIVAGHADGTFRPAESLSRAQLASLVTRLLDAIRYPLPQSPPDAFDDDDGSAHEHAINQLAAVGIVQGESRDTYAPDGPITRAQLATLLVRTWDEATGSQLPAGESPFSDVSGVHADAIGTAHTSGLVQGVTADRYEPSRAVTRGQAASLLMRLASAMVLNGWTQPPPP